MPYQTMTLTDLLSEPTVRIGAAMLVLLVVAAFGFFLVSRLRDYTTQDQEEPLEMLSNLEEMRLKGDITEEEYRNIQTATQTQVGEDSSIQPSDDEIAADWDSPPKTGESDAE